LAVGTKNARDHPCIYTHAMRLNLEISFERIPFELVNCGSGRIFKRR
jgi:hypothetical protein